MLDLRSPRVGYLVLMWLLSTFLFLHAPAHLTSVLFHWDFQWLPVSHSSTSLSLDIISPSFCCTEWGSPVKLGALDTVWEMTRFEMLGKFYCFFKIFNFIFYLKDNCFTKLCWFLPNSLLFTDVLCCSSVLTEVSLVHNSRGMWCLLSSWW